MHIAAFADVHANLTALRAVLRDIDAHGPFDLVVSNGDQIFGGPRPLETWQELERIGAYCLCGNTERDLGTGEFPPAPAGGRWRDRILEVFDWTMEALPGEIIARAAALPRRLERDIDGGPLLVISHANGINLDDFIWADTDPAELDRLIGTPRPALLVVGHIHAPMDLQVGPTRVLRAGSVGLMYEANAYNQACIGPRSPGTRRAARGTAEARRMRCSGTTVLAEIAAGDAVGYPGTEILPGYERA